MPRNSSTLAFLVIGSDGQVGRALISQLRSRSIPYQAITASEAYEPASLSGFLTNFSDYRFVINALYEEPQQFSPDVSTSWLTTCEDIAKRATQAGQAVFQLSSGRVFSGRSLRGYHESDERDSQTAVGQTFIKLEDQLTEHCPRSVLLRVDWLFSEQNDNFLTRLVDAAIEKEELCISNSMRGCPTDAHTVARVIVAIAEQVDCGVSKPDLWGVYHYADSDACTLYTFAKTVITVVKSMSEVRVETIGEVDTRETVDGEKQPENHELNCKKILSTFGIKQKPWRRSVHEVLKGKLSEAG